MLLKQIVKVFYLLIALSLALCLLWRRREVHPPT